MRRNPRKQSKDKIIKAFEDRIIGDLRNWGGGREGEEDFCKSIRVGNSLSKHYIECKNDGDRSKTLSIKELLDKIKAYLKGHK